MLVIRRRCGESLMIGDDVEIEVLECGGTHVKLGIRAPKQITVLRKEIHLTGRQNRLATGELSSADMSRLLKSLR
ncbi:MAG TPA: carbon storage regulator CsrA [Bryobacteraceae bacterium]|jgi:carbon storage regulator|nr:carbon storage regulator CsrA [Bryobacteraceae bacterium]